MTANEIAELINKYGIGIVAIAVLAVVVVYFYKQQQAAHEAALKEASERIKEINARAERAEQEAKALNEELRRSLMIGFAVKQTMIEAAKELRETNVS